MAYTAYFGTFAKHENSTKQPSYQSWARFDVVLKNGADISKPVISLSADFATISSFNYAILLGRFYWIRERNMERAGLCILQLEIDPLASWKTEIGSSKLYILRASAASDGAIVDSFYPVKASSTKYHQNQDSGVPGDYNTGVVVLNVSGTKTAAGTTLIQFTPANFSAFITALYTGLNGFQLRDITNRVIQAFGGNPQNLINSAMWFPYPFDVKSVEYISIGNWDSGIQGGVITDPIYTLGDYTYTLNKHPLAASRGSYLNLAPFTQYTIGLPGCGVITLDNTKLLNENSITIQRSMDALSGQLITKVLATSSGQVLAYLNGQIGIPITLQGSGNVNSIVGGTIATIGGIAAAITGGAAGIIRNVGSAIGSAIDNIGGTPTSTSMGSGAAGIMLEAGWLDTICYDIAPEDNARNGRPLCQIRTPASLGGFMIAQKGDIEAAAPLPELLAIKNYLETGFYYE